jgi:hypothetical protein
MRRPTIAAGVIRSASQVVSVMRRRFFPGLNMKLELHIESKPLDIEIDDVVAGLLAARLSLPPGSDNQDTLAHYLSEKGAPWTLDEEHMRRRILRRLILDIADPALVIRHLMTDQ